MKFPSLTRLLPSWKNAALAVLSAVLLVLAFPDFEFWFLAWFALVPLMWAVEREKESPAKSFVLGWIFGTIFFYGTCWWLTFAPIAYAGFPPVLAYVLLFFVTLIAGVFPGIFASLLGFSLKRFGSIALLAAPFIWVFTEFLRYWLTGNNWNAIGYSQAFSLLLRPSAIFGGVYLVSFWVIAINSVCVLTALSLVRIFLRFDDYSNNVKPHKDALFVVLLTVILILPFAFPPNFHWIDNPSDGIDAVIVAIQPNVPMSGLNPQKWQELRRRHVELAEGALQKLNQQLTTDHRPPATVIFPESPMNFMYDEDEEFREFVSAFAAKNSVNVLFNSAEPDKANGKYFNSAVLVDTEGREVAQYDKIYLMPFGESVPVPLRSIVPALVGSFSYGSEYDLLPLGDAKAGVMICFESHFGELSREYVKRGADVIIEMTNDGYLGPTPVLRQHLANAVFRAVETNRPVLRVTNVGITAYINERGEILDPAPSYTEDTRIWQVSKSDGGQTFYVKYGDWFAWLSSLITVGSLVFAFWRRKISAN
jgi:apolipoprotein N-acyltransferase